MDYKLHRDLIAVVYDQLPRVLRDRITVRVQTDAHLIRPKALFTTEKGNTWECYLEPRDIHGVIVPCHVPEEFLAKLMVVP